MLASFRCALLSYRSFLFIGFQLLQLVCIANVFLSIILIKQCIPSCVVIQIEQQKKDNENGIENSAGTTSTFIWLSVLSYEVHGIKQTTIYGWGLLTEKFICCWDSPSCVFFKIYYFCFYLLKRLIAFIFFLCAMKSTVKSWVLPGKSLTYIDTLHRGYKSRRK